MKKNIAIISICLCLVYYLFTNNPLVSTSILNSCNIFIRRVFGTLFPMYIISKILINYNFPYYLYKLTGSSYLYIFIMSILSGSPNNAIIIKDLLSNEIISEEDANNYIMCNFFLNPLFLYTMLSSFLPKKLSIIIILISYFSNIILYKFNHTINSKKIKKTKELPLDKLLIEEISKSSLIFLNILEMLILFNLIILLLPERLKFFSGLIETTNGLFYLATSFNFLYIKAILSLIFINFGGLCILMQIKTVLIDSKIKTINYLYGRFYATFIALLIFLLLTFFFKEYLF